MRRWRECGLEANVCAMDAWRSRHGTLCFEDQVVLLRGRAISKGELPRRLLKIDGFVVITILLFVAKMYSLWDKSFLGGGTAMNAMLVVVARARSLCKAVAKRIQHRKCVMPNVRLHRPATLNLSHDRRGARLKLCCLRRDRRLCWNCPTILLLGSWRLPPKARPRVRISAIERQLGSREFTHIEDVP